MTNDLGKSHVGMLACAQCGAPIGVLLDRRLKNTFENGRNYSDGQTLCDECKEQSRKAREIVDAGGLYFKCNVCGVTGAIRLNENTREFVAAVRRIAKVPKGPVGVSLDNCSQHTVEV